MDTGSIVPDLHAEGNLAKIANRSLFVDIAGPGENALANVSLEPVYRRLFAEDGSAGEFPEYEKKDYFLSSEMIGLHKAALVDAIAGIANFGHPGIIMCRGRNGPPPLEDAERLDQIVRASVFPSPHFTVERLTIAGSVVDVIVIPGSALRPHFIRDPSGANRFYIALRGAANNATAARHQVDEMYRESTIETIRRAFPNLRVETDGKDVVLSYIMDIGYGLDPE